MLLAPIRVSISKHWSPILLQRLEKSYMVQKSIPLSRAYRCLYSEDLFLAAYNKIGRNQGSLTPGTENDTADGMSMKRIRSIIKKLRHERSMESRMSWKLSRPVWWGAAGKVPLW